MIAQTRQSQARDEATRRELAGNAGKSQQRAEQIAKAIRNLGGIPDVLGVAFGRLTAVAKTQFEQGQTLTDALLGDLQLEHQLRDRAELVRMLAESAGKRELVRLGERLESAHTETIDWIRTRLGEAAVGGPTAIQPTPVQAGVGAVRRFAAFPAHQVAQGLNRSIGALSSLTNRAGESIETNVEKAQQLKEAAEEIFVAGRDAALDADELPITGYDELSADRAVQAEDVRATLAYEQANKGRKSVIKAGETQLTEIAQVARTGGSIKAKRREEIIDLTVEELRDRASEADIQGRSGMSKDELVKALTS
jgi:bacterioferritin (cytochrome b1)